MAKPRGRVVDHHGEPPGSSWPVSARGSAGWERSWAISEGPWPISEGSWTWLIARCWRPSWIQRAPQLVQMAVGYRPKPMVTRADRHNGQCGIRTSLTSLVVSLCGVVASRTGGGRSVGADTLVAGAVGARAGMVAAPLASSGGVAWPATPPARLNWALCPHCLPQGSLLDRGVI